MPVQKKQVSATVAIICNAYDETETAGQMISAITHMQSFESIRFAIAMYSERLHAIRNRSPHERAQHLESRFPALFDCSPVILHQLAAND